MTDDEIDAVLIPKLAKHIGMAEVDVRILPFDRIAFRAGMREAARMVNEECTRILAVQTIPPRGNTDEAVNLQARMCAVMLPGLADAIERAAGGER
jgi:hypothetical protein